MEIDRKLIAELGVSAAAVVAFIAVAIFVTQAYGAPSTLSGEFSGEVTGEVTNESSGAFTGELTANVSGNLAGTVSGEVNGTAPEGASGTFTRDVNGTVVGDVPANESDAFTGNATGQFLEGDGNFSGQVSGSVEGNSTTAPSIQPEGGLAMVGVIGLFVVLMAGAGLIMYRLDFDDE